MRNKYYFIFFFCLFLILFTVHTRGIAYPDEGYMVNSAKRLLQGEKMYRDFHFVYTPFVPVYTAFFFLIFDESLLAARLAALSFSLATVFLLLFALRNYEKRFCLLILPLAVYSVWGPLQINFVWPSMAALSLGVMAVSLLLIAHIRGRNFWYIASGFSAALAFLSKQNLGFAVVASVIVGAVYLTMISNKNYRWNKVGYVCLGIGGGIFIFVGWLLASGTFSSFLNNFMLNIWQKIVIEGTIATPVVYGNSFYSFAKFIFYISGALLGFFALILSYRKRSPLFVGALFSLLFTLTGIRPVTDFVHIAPLFATLGIVIIILYRLSSYSLVRGALLLYTFFLLLIGFYIPIFVSYYRWSPPYREQTMFAAYPRARIFIDRKSNETILQLINTLNTRSSQNEYIFINYYAPMVYFLLDRQNATKYDYISPTAISIREQLDAIDSLEKRNVRFILTHELARHDSSVLAKYILAYFRKIKQVGDFAIWERKKKEVTSH